MPRILSPEQWRRALVGLLAFPLLVVGEFLRLVGQGNGAYALVDWLWRAWMGRGMDPAMSRVAWRRWAAVALSLLVLVVTLYLVIGIVANVAYPLRPDRKPTDWGGPSLAGRWALHAAGGVLFALATPLVGARLRGVMQRLL